MNFFEPPPPPPEPRVHKPQPVWMGPPENELGESVSIRVVLVKRDDLAIAVTDLVAYSTGIAGRLLIRRRTDEPRFMHPMHPMMRHGLAGAGEIPAELLRFGVELADGRRATSIGGPPRSGGEPPPAVLMMRGGGGGGRSWEMGFWLWPLPPAGPLKFVVEWPSLGVEQTHVEIDAAPLVSAATRSEVLWEDDGRGSSGGFSAQTGHIQLRQLRRL